MGSDMDTRIAEFDHFAALAVEDLIDWLREAPEALIATARERLVLGFDNYSDGPMFKMGITRLGIEASEELADAIVYIARQLTLIEQL
jgi:hypothetical protein